MLKFVSGTGNISNRETKSEAARPPEPEGNKKALQMKERRVIKMYVTYESLIQIGIFIIALVTLCYEVFKGKKD